VNKTNPAIVLIHWRKKWAR